MKKISIKKINEQARLWESSFCSNNDRGRRFVRFAVAGDQWDANVPEKRAIANKESLTFNLCLKHLKMAKAQSKEIEYTVDISPMNDMAQENVEESSAFMMLIQSIVLSNNMLNTFSSCFDRCLEFGYSFVEINYERENFETLNCVPVVRLHKDQSIAFWDKNCVHPQKIDGRYCGLKRRVSKSEVMTKYKKLRDKIKLDDTNNVMIDYWYRDYFDVPFVLLKSGVYKRKDFLSDDDMNNLMAEEDKREMEDGKKIPLERMAPVCKIYFCRYLNDIPLEGPKEFPTDDLPLAFNDALTYWHPDEGEFTMPLAYPLEGAQKLHNYANSQLATQAKNCSSDKWIFGHEHVSTQTEIESAQKINTYEGGLIFGGNTQTIRREKGSDLSPSMVQFSQFIKSEIDEIGGSMGNVANPQQTVLSGEAMDKITKNMNAINMDLIAKQSVFVNTCGRLIKQMIPKIITEERTILIKKQDGSGQALTVNQALPTGEIKNNIKDINNNYYYEIKSGPSSTMEKENTVKYLAEMYSIDPNLLKTTGDIYVRCLQTPYAGEIERRLSATMDVNLIKFSQGEITFDEYNKLEQQQQQQQFQQQLQQAAQMNKVNPQASAANTMAAAEHKKANATLMNAQTQYHKMLNEAIGNNEKLKLQYAEAMIKNQGQQGDHYLEMVRNSLMANQQTIDALKHAATTQD